MVIALWGLRSTNDNKTRKIYVKVRNNSQKVIITLVFIVRDKTYKKEIALKENAEEEVWIDHDRKGECVVAVSEAKSVMLTQKELNLDAEEDM